MDIDAAKRDSQDGVVEKIAARVRERASELRFNARSLGEAVGVPSSSAHNYWNGSRGWPSEKLGDLADVLGTNVDALVTGRGFSQRHLVDANDADWVEIPEYALLEIDERGKASSIATTNLRRDWLSSSLGEASGLWLTRLPAPFDALTLGTGAVLICKDHQAGERLFDGTHYLWWINGGVVMAPFARREGAPGDRFVLARDVGNLEDQYLPIARVVGQLARPI
ncbi:MAG: hypothetical protein IT553_03055 [Sphingomonadaceae bacterium]|nr:hypothetical protein [Sphingomonadaceae bacterium]